MAEFTGFSHGLGIGGWLTNYKRFAVLPEDKRFPLTVGDMEHFDSYITRRDVDYIASLGFDHIRLAFDQIVLEEYENPGCCRPRIWALLENFVSWCEDAGLNVVFNIHKAIGNYCDAAESVSLLDDAGLQERFIALWTTIEKHFTAKRNIAFELLNEVRNVPPEQWNHFAYRIVSAIRELNPSRKIVLGGTCWNNPDAFPQLRRCDDPNLIYTWHFYSPFEFTHQQGLLTGNHFYNRVMPYPAEDAERYRDACRVMYHSQNPLADVKKIDRDYLELLMKPALDAADSNPNQIFWCGEFGTIRHTKLEYRINYMRDVISILKKHHVSYCAWNYLSTPYDGNRFSVVDDDSRLILSEEFGRVLSGQFEI